MAKYIPLEPLLAEIDKRQRMLVPYSPFDKGGMVELQVLKDKLNTLEVKEVDLEQELEDFLEKNIDSNGFFNPIDVAKHFFELGLHYSQTDDSYIEGVKGSYTTTDKD